ncbi:MAG: SIS domain-containing protein [Anaerolineae bacterium]|nr:SIS domain-containing protein [Anaerolineae bacterium]
MTEDVYQQLLQMPLTQLADLALAGLQRQGAMVAQVIESVRGQLDDVVGAISPERIYLAGCGDSYFAALAARRAFEQLTGLSTVALPSMECAHYTFLPPGSLVIVISSGGEVNMTLKAGRAARRAGVEVIGVTANKSSRVAQEFPCLLTDPELAGSDYGAQVALILGNFSLSLAALYLVAIRLGRNGGYLDESTAGEIEVQIEAIPEAIERAMSYSAAIREYLESVSDETDFYFLGAGPSYGAALFYQAKFFEQAQRPVYGVELEEFAHEQFFLLRPGKEAQVWFIVPTGSSRERALEVMAACREMGAGLVAVTTSPDDQMQEKADLTFTVGAVAEIFSPMVSVVPGELLGIHAFARWGSELLSASGLSRRMAVGRQLTRKGKS